MNTRAPSGMWEWTRLLQQIAPSDGVIATGLAWSTHCWTWRHDVAESAKASPLPLSKFARDCRPGTAERTVRRHLSQLRDLGLLERSQAHSRWTNDAFVPRVPVAAEPVNSGHQRPVQEINSGHQRPVQEINSGHSTHQQWPPVANVYSPASKPENPPHARTHTRVREAMGDDSPEQGRGEMAAPNGAKTQAELALHLAEADIPIEMRQLIDDQWRGRTLAEILPLVEKGWTAQELARRVNRSWFGVGHPGSALRQRFVALQVLPVPNRDKAWTERDAQDHVVAPELCPHEAAGGVKACAFCRTGTEPETTAAESAHDPSMDGPPGPDSVREQLRAGRRKGRAS